MKSVFTSSNFGIAPERTARRNAIEQAVTKVFEQYGYGEITLPMYEYYDVFKTVTHNFKDKNIISFTDRKSGRSLVLRPDFTPQVCRMVAGYHKDYPLPIRVYYKGSVFRNVNIDEGNKAEYYQMGFELYGMDELNGDKELLLCAKRALDTVKMQNYRFVLGDAAFLIRVGELLGKESDKYFDILTQKRIHEHEEFVKALKVSEKLKEALLTLPFAFGGLSTVEKLRKQFSFDAVLSERCGYILELFRILIKLGLDEEKLVFDAAELRGLDYYTGISLEIIHKKSGAMLGGGGRYDNLMQKFNLPYTACGMAFSLAEIEEYANLDYKVFEYDWLVVGAENINKAEELRAEGLTVIFLPDCDKLKEFSKVVKYKNIFVTS